MEESSKRNRRWTAEEVDFLCKHWGHIPLEPLAKQLKRTTHAVRGKARDMGLELPPRDTRTLVEFAKHSGFSRPKIRSTLRRLDIKPSRRPAALKGGLTRTYALTAEEQERVLKHMLENPHEFRNMRGSRRSERGIWGVGKKPHACVVCSTYQRPHFAKGMCASCYNRTKRRRRRAYAVRCLPEGCPI